MSALRDFVDKAAAWDALAEKNMRIAELQRQLDDARAELARANEKLAALRAKREVQLSRLASGIGAPADEFGAW